jgi:hypothetical protein
MKKLFSNMLVPIGRGEEEGVVAEEATRIADRLQCHMHLLDMKGAEGLPEKLIAEYHRRHPVDLILLRKKKGLSGELFRHTSSVNINLLSKKISCPILTISERPDPPVLKHIVLPVGGMLPMRRLLFATYLAKISHSTIHLVSPVGKTRKADEFRENLLKSYRLLRENTQLPIECMTAPGSSLGEVAWGYAQKIKADMILISPGKESLISGFLKGLRSRFLSRLFSTSLPNVSLIPVMTIT